MRLAHRGMLRWLALAIFIAAAITDILDGYFARMWGQQSSLGRMLDPIADKLLVASCLLMLAADGTIRGWSLLAAVIILCREILVSGLREFLADLHVSIPVERKRDHFVTRIPNLPRLTKRQIPSICYRFTTDGWKNSREVGSRLTHDEHGSAMIEFDILCAFPLIGRLDGAFYLRGEGGPGWRKATPRFGGYVFAIPDRQELNGMLVGVRERTM